MILWLDFFETAAIIGRLFFIQSVCRLRYGIFICGKSNQKKIYTTSIVGKY